MMCANGTWPGMYMGFRWSRSLKKTVIPKSDAIVCTNSINGTWEVEDYYVESFQPCRTNQKGKTSGACPDTALGGARDIRDIFWFSEDSVGYCMFSQSLHASEKYDRMITLRKSQEIVWVLGLVGADGQLRGPSRIAGPSTQRINFRRGQPCTSHQLKHCCNSIIQE